MDITEYLRDKEKRLEKGNRLIKDFHVFDFNYLPEKPLMREEIRPVADALLRYMKTGVPNHVLIIGSRGAGKTLLVKSLVNHLRSRPDSPRFLYVNCRHHNTSFKILAEVLGARPRGYALDELWSEFEARFPKGLVFILDEVDLISEKDRNKDILYLLSNNPRFHALLDPSIRSALQPEIVHFKEYNADQVFKILEERARLGLRKTHGEVLRHITGLTVRNTNADIRVGIKTLYFCAVEPDAGVEPNFQRARRDIAADIVNDLNDKNLLILKAAHIDREKYVKSVYALYRRLSEAGHEPPFSYVHFYSNLSYLQSLGLILLLSTKVRRSYTNRIQILFDPEILESACKARFGSAD